MIVTFDPITIPAAFQWFVLVLVVILVWALVVNLCSLIRAKAGQLNAQAYTSGRMTNHVFGPEKKK